jgi:DNA-directed RNA polymerase III subunit RPC1
MAAALAGDLAGNPVKEQVYDGIPKRFKQINFGIQSTINIGKQAVIEISRHELYDIENNRQPRPNSALDPRLVGAFPVRCLIIHVKVGS